MSRFDRYVISILCICAAAFVLPLTAQAACPISDSTDDKMTELVEERYDMIPKTIRKQYENCGGIIEITDFTTVTAELWQDGGSNISVGSFAAGVYDPNTNRILLTDYCASSAVCHEVGHFADMKCLGNTSQTSAFNKIFTAESGDFDEGGNDYAASDVREYFAEAFSEYVTCAGYLKNTVPKTYSYIDSLMQPYGGTTTDKVTAMPDEEYHMVDVIPSKKLKELAKKVKEGAISALPDNIADALGKYGLSEEQIESLKKAIDEDPEQAGKDLGEKASQAMSDIDWDSIKEDSRKKGEEFANKINSWIGG
ncbi:MAG: hypothetical protein WCQ94_06735 [Lachnospiraceae bacterium]|nr:hypothetical protein [Lachnospiraceae bacterium]MDD4524898.1 hypothetical protein [Lachnospiraceae bacterium]